MSRTLVGLAAGMALFATAFLPSPTAAGDDAPAPAAAPAPMETRLFEVGGLLMGRAQMEGEDGPFTLSPHNATDAESAHFDRTEGDAGEERIRPLGGINDLIELVKSGAAARPAAWDQEGTSIAAVNDRFLLVRGPRALQEEVAAFLARTETQAMGNVTVDLMEVEGDPAAIRGAGGVPAAISSGAVRVVAGLRTVGQLAHRVCAFAGRERSFLMDHDVEVAKEAATSDPIVGVQPEGMAAQVYVDAVSPGIVLDVRAWGARVAGERSIRTAHGDLVEVPDVDGWSVVSQVRAKPGEWTVLPVSGGRALCVRATSRAALPPKATPALPTSARGDAQAPVLSRSFPCSDFGSMIPPRVGPRIELARSSSANPPSTALPEPTPILVEDAFADLLQRTVAPESWEYEGRAFAVKNGVLHVRQDAKVLAGVESFLAAMRAQVAGGYRFKATVLSLPLSSFPEWVNGLGDGADLAADGGAALLARPGAALLGEAAVRVSRGGRNASFAGLLKRYVSDYDVEVAEKSVAGKPVVSEVPVGASLDVQAAGAAGGAAVACEVRLDRSTWDGSRALATEHGEIEAPTLGLLRLRGGCEIPLGSTRIVGVGIEGEQATLVLLTANSD